MNQVTPFIKTLVELYAVGKIQATKLRELLKNKTITQEEYEYIVNSKEKR